MIFFFSEDIQSTILYLGWLHWKISSTFSKKSHLISAFLCSFFWASSLIISSRSWKSIWFWIIYVSISDIFLFFWWIFWAIFHSFIAQSSFFYKISSQMLFSINIHLELYSSVNDFNFCDFEAALKTFFIMISICFTAFFQAFLCLMILFLQYTHSEVKASLNL